MVRKLFHTIQLCAVFLLCLPGVARAYGFDPTRALLIERYSLQSKKALEAQNKAQALMTTGHMSIEAEVEAASDFQREFNNYLDLFHDILGFAAEIYGIYYEINQMSKNISVLSKVLSEHPANILATAFHTRRNAVYRNIITNGVYIVQDIKALCIDNAKMTERDKMEMIGAVRPKLRQMNRQLRILTLTIRHTTFLDVWYEITDRARYYGEVDKRGIIEQCMRDWKHNAYQK